MLRLILRGIITGVASIQYNADPTSEPLPPMTLGLAGVRSVMIIDMNDAIAWVVPLSRKSDAVNSTQELTVYTLHHNHPIYHSVFGPCDHSVSAGPGLG